MCKGVDYSFGADFLEGYSGRPSRESVDHREEVTVAVGFGHHGDVDVNVRESSIGDGEFMDGRDRVSANFGSLAVEAVSRPS